MSLTHTIVIIDDEPDLSHAWATVLQRAGYLVTIATSARDACQCLKVGLSDLTFLDFSRLEDDELRQFGEICAQQTNLSIVVLTANATRELAAEARRLGARDDPQMLGKLQCFLAQIPEGPGEL
jgi:DNA-binding NtrC family response regulator